MTLTKLQRPQNLQSELKRFFDVHFVPTSLIYDPACVQLFARRLLATNRPYVWFLTIPSGSRGWSGPARVVHHSPRAGPLGRLDVQYTLGRTSEKRTSKLPVCGKASCLMIRIVTA